MCACRKPFGDTGRIKMCALLFIIITIIIIYIIIIII